MKTSFESMMTDDRRKLVKRWTIGAFVFYGLIVAATVALISIGINSSSGLANSDESASNPDLDGYAVSVARPVRSSQLGPSNSADVTTGYNRATAAESVSPPRAAARPIPEVDEMGKTPTTPQDVLVENGWDFNAPNGVPGFEPLQAGSVPAAAMPQLTARAKR